MISYEEACRLIEHHVTSRGAEMVELQHAAGRRLADDVTARVCSPPFDKAAMDGYAVREEDVRELPAVLTQVGEVFAGGCVERSIGPNQCARIATGAPVPPGADMVVMQEHTEELSDNRVRIKKLSGGNICRRGEDVQAGEVVLSAGQLLDHLHVGVAGAAGHGQLRVYKRPSVALLCTGEEVMEPGDDIRDGHIFNANGPILRSLFQNLGYTPQYLGTVGDSRDELETVMTAGLKHDILIITGGVSVGPYDLVPETLDAQGVETIFHRWKVKPGKPVFFGHRGNTCVIGLPGNPLSVFVSFHLVVRQALLAMEGAEGDIPEFQSGRITEGVSDKARRRSFAPCRVTTYNGENLVIPLPYHGSADIASSASADAFFTLPEGCTGIEEGELVHYFEV
ncbi:MAG: gephyrin-like molybdotransferase Glp [Planctomycetota bacterium]